MQPGTVQHVAFMTVPFSVRRRSLIKFYALFTQAFLRCEMKREKSHKEISPNCFLAPFWKGREKQNKSGQQKITEFLKEDCKTVFPYKTSSNTFSFCLIKMSFIIDQQHSLRQTKHNSFLRKACAHSRINRTLKGSIVEQIFGSMGSQLFTAGSLLFLHNFSRETRQGNSIYHKIYDTRLPNGAEFMLLATRCRSFSSGLSLHQKSIHHQRECISKILSEHNG